MRLALILDHRGEPDRRAHPAAVRRLRWLLYELDPTIELGRTVAGDKHAGAGAPQGAASPNSLAERAAADLPRNWLARIRELTVQGPRPAARTYGRSLHRQGAPALLTVPGGRGRSTPPGSWPRSPTSAASRPRRSSRSTPASRRWGTRPRDPAAQTPPQPLRQPPAQRRPAHDRPHPSPRSRARPGEYIARRLQRRQDRQRSHPRPQTPPHPHSSTASSSPTPLDRGARTAVGSVSHWCLVRIRQPPGLRRAAYQWTEVITCHLRRPPVASALAAVHGIRRGLHAAPPTPASAFGWRSGRRAAPLACVPDGVAARFRCGARGPAGGPPRSPPHRPACGPARRRRRRPRAFRRGSPSGRPAPSRRGSGGRRARPPARGA